MYEKIRKFTKHDDNEGSDRFVTKIILSQLWHQPVEVASTPSTFLISAFYKMNNVSHFWINLPIIKQ